MFEELEAEDDSTVASADDNDVLIRREGGHGTPVTSHSVCDGRSNSKIIQKKEKHELKNFNKNAWVLFISIGLFSTFDAS